MKEQQSTGTRTHSANEHCHGKAHFSSVVFVDVDVAALFFVCVTFFSKINYAADTVGNEMKTLFSSLLTLLSRD